MHHLKRAARVLCLYFSYGKLYGEKVLWKIAKMCRKSRKNTIFSTVDTDDFTNLVVLRACRRSKCYFIIKKTRSL